MKPRGPIEWAIAIFGTVTAVVEAVLLYLLFSLATAAGRFWGLAREGWANGIAYGQEYADQLRRIGEDDEDRPTLAT